QLDSQDMFSRQPFHKTARRQNGVGVERGCRK
ncbi:MAG: hypothetical protein ACI9TI_002014, partial [Natronomonas sp.]